MRHPPGLIILLLVEVLAVQLGCVAYEYVLVRGVEAGRAAGMLVALGVPGPMLRVLASRPLVVLEVGAHRLGCRATCLCVCVARGQRIAVIGG